MSNSVDQRIVQMQFDNAQFERGVGTTLASLKALDQGLQLKSGLTGLTDVDAAASRLNFSELVSDVNDLNDKLSALGVIGFTAISRLTNSLMDLGSGVVKALTVDPLTDGLDEYKLKMDSITTIMSNTKSKGTTLDEVNEVLAELNDYADQTIYNFAEMTRNIGTFTAAGVDLKTSASAIKGIANLAAVSGSNSQQASVAMYQLSQALASGTVKLMDWNSVLNAGMGGQVFQDALIRTSEHLKTGAKDAIATEGSFRESLKQGWLTSEVLTETLNQFTMLGTEEERQHLKRLGYTDEEIAAVFTMGQTATDAATKVKTFQQLIDTTKEALGSGWATSWEYIIGNMEQAQELWTGISTAINGVIDALSNPRNEFLKTWNEQGGWDALLGKEGTLAELGGILTDLLKPLADAYNQVFSSVLDPEGLGMMAVEASKGLLELVKSVRHFIETSETAKVVAFVLRTAFTGLFEIVKLVGMVVGGTFIGAFKLVGTVLKTAVKAIEFVITTVKNLHETITAFALANVFEPLSRFITETLKLESVGQLIHDLGGLFTTFFSILANGHNANNDRMKEMFTNIVNEDIARIAERVGSALRTFADGLSHVFSVVKDAASKGAVIVFDKLQKVWERIVPILEKVRGKIVAAWNTLRDAFVNAGFSLDPFIEIFQGFGEAFGRFFESVFSEGFSIDKVFELFKELGENVQTFMGELGPAFEAFTSTIGAAVSGEFSGAMETIWGWLSNVEGPLSSIINGLKDLVNAIGEAGSSLKLPFGDSGAMGTVSGMADAVETASKAVWDFSTVLQMIKNPMKTVSNFISKGLNGIAGGINEFIESLDTPAIASLVEKFTDLAILGGVGAGLYQFFNLVQNVSGLLGSWKAVCTALETGLTTLNKTLGAAKTAMYASVLVSVAVSIGILVAALFALTKMDMDKVNEALPVLGKIAAGLIVAVLAFSVAARIAKANAGSIMAMSGVIMSIIAVLFSMIAMTAILGLIPESVVEQGEAALAGIVRMLTVLIVAMGVATKASTGMASATASITQIAVAIALLAGIVVVLGAIPDGIIQKGIVVVIGLSVILGVLTAVMAHFGKGATVSATALMEMAAAIAILAGAMVVVSLIDSSKLSDTVAAVSLLMIIMTVVLGIISGFNPVAFQEAAVSMIIFSAAIALVSAAMAGLAAVGALGGDLVTAIQALAVIMIGLTVSAVALSAVGPEMYKGAQAVMFVAGAITLLSAVLVVLSLMNVNEINRSLVQLGIVVTIAAVAFGVIAAISYYAAPGLLALTTVLLALGVVMISFGAGALMFAAAVTLMSQVTPEAVDSMIEAFQHLCLGLWDSVDEIAMAVAGIGMGITAGILAAIPGIIAVLLALVGAIVGVLIASGPLLGGAAVLVVAGIIDGFATGLEEHGEAITKALIHLGQVIMNGVGNAISDGVNTFNTWLYEVTGGLMGVDTEAAKAALAAKDSYAGTLKDGTAEVAEAATGLKDATVEPLKQGSEEIGLTTDQIMDKLNELTGMNISLGEGVIDRKSLEAMGVDVEAYCASIGVDSSEDLLAMLNSGLANGSIDMSSITGQAEQQMSEGGQESVEAFVESAESTAASTDMSGSLTPMVTNAVDMAVVAEQGAEAAAVTSSSYSENMVFDATEAMNAAVDMAVVAEQGAEAAAVTSSSYSEGVDRGVSGMSTVIQSAMSSAISAVSSLAGYARSQGSYVGSAMGGGVSSGLRAMYWEVSSAASSLVSTAASAMRAVGIIRSPSRLTKEIGKYMAEGFALGMSENVGMADRAARSLVESAMDSMVTQAGYLMGLLDDIDDQPVITPVLDLSQVESGMGAFDGLFSRSQLLSTDGIGLTEPAMALLDNIPTRQSTTNNLTYEINVSASGNGDDIARQVTKAIRAQELMRGRR